MRILLSGTTGSPSVTHPSANCPNEINKNRRADSSKHFTWLDVMLIRHFDLDLTVVFGSSSGAGMLLIRNGRDSAHPFNDVAICLGSTTRVVQLFYYAISADR